MAHSSQSDMSTAETYEEVTLNLGNNDGQARKSTNPQLLSTTTGGVENSWRICMMAFGSVMLVIGTSSTGVALFNDTPKSTLFILGMSLVAIGGIMVVFSCLRNVFKKEKPGRKESFSMLVCETVQKTPTV